MARRNRRHGAAGGAAERSVRHRTDTELGAKRSHELTMLKGEEWYKLFLSAKALDERVVVPPEPDPYCAITKRTWNTVRCPPRPFVYSCVCLHCLYMHMSDRLFAWPVFVPAACIWIGSYKVGMKQGGVQVEARHEGSG